MRRARRIAAALIVGLALTSPVRANPAQPFTYSLVYSADSIYGAYAPHTCLTEDSFRTWYGQGSLAGTFTTTVTYCGDPLSPGGEGLSVRLTNIKKAHDLAITYPDGRVTHGDWQCVVTPAPFDGIIEAGTYTITLTAAYRDVFLDVESGMASAQWRAGHCP